MGAGAGEQPLTAAAAGHGRRAWQLAYSLVALAGIARELTASQRDLGNLLLLAFVVAFGFYRDRSGWVMPFFGSIGILSEVREGASRDPAMLALFAILAGLGIVESWLRRHAVHEQAGAPERSRPTFTQRWRSRTLGPDLIAAAGMLLLGLGALLVLLQGGASRRVLGLGVASWGLGVGVIKAPLYRLIVPRLRRRGIAPARIGVANGLVSATGELGSAALFFALVLSPLPPIDRVAFGAAAAIVEAVLLAFAAVADWNPLQGTELGEGAAAVERVIDAQPHGVRVLLPVLERALTFPIHISTRALVYAGIHLGAPLAPAFAFAAFAAVDGYVTFALLRGEPTVRRLVLLYGLLALLAAAVTLAALPFVGTG